MTTRIHYPTDGQDREIRATVYSRLRHLGFRRTWWRGPIRHKRTGITVTVTRAVVYLDFPDQAAADEARRLVALTRLGGRTLPGIVRDVVNAIHMQEGRKTAGLSPR